MYASIIRSKREFKNLMTKDGWAGKVLRVGEKHHVAWTFPTLHEYIFDCSPVDCGDLPDDVVDIVEHQRESDDDIVLSLNQFVQDSPENDSYIYEDNETEDHDGLVAPEEICELTLHPEGGEVIMNVSELDDVCEMLDDKDEEEDFTLKHTFFDLDQDSMKIISFPDLKKNLEGNLCCQVCATTKKHVGFITMEQQTFKLATILNFICSYGHYFSIAPEQVDEAKVDSSDNFKINFCFILAMKILGKGLQTMSTFLGLLGIWVSEGIYKV